LFLSTLRGREHSDVGLEGYRYASLATATAARDLLLADRGGKRDAGSEL